MVILKQSKNVNKIPCIWSITRNLNVAKRSHVAKTTETVDVGGTRNLTYSDLIQSHLPDENICCASVFCAKLGLLRLVWRKKNMFCIFYFLF